MTFLEKSYSSEPGEGLANHLNKTLKSQNVECNICMAHTNLLVEIHYCCYDLNVAFNKANVHCAIK